MTEQRSCLSYHPARATIAGLILAVASCGTSVKSIQTGGSDEMARYKNETSELRIHFEGLANNHGDLRLVLVRDSPEAETTFPPIDTSKAFAAVIVPTDQQKTEIIVPDVPYGRYAAMVMHDENRNGQLDFTISNSDWVKTYIPVLPNWPSEGYGSTGKKPGLFALMKMGPPTFNTAAFMVHAPVTETTVHMNYYYKHWGWPEFILMIATLGAR